MCVVVLITNMRTEIELFHLHISCVRKRHMDDYHGVWDEYHHFVSNFWVENITGSPPSASGVNNKIERNSISIKIDFTLLLEWIIEYKELKTLFLVGSFEYLSGFYFCPSVVWIYLASSINVDFESKQSLLSKLTSKIQEVG